MTAGARRVAVLLSSLEVAAGRALLRELPPPDREQVLIEVARLEVEPPSREEVEATLRGFQEMRDAAPALGPGGRDAARALVDPEGDPEERRRLLERIESAVQSVPFGFLAKAGSAQVAEALRDEHPQTLALIVACLPPAASAPLIDRLPMKTRIDVVRRLASMEPIAPEAVKRIERALETRFASRRGAGAPAPGGLASALSILGRTLPGTSRDVLAGLEAEDPALAERLGDGLYPFDDLKDADDSGLVALASAVDLKRMATALKSPAPEFATRLFRVLAPAEAALLVETLDGMGPATLQEVADARREIAKTARRLETQGALRVRRTPGRTV